jgi:formate-dependent nitrite reductase cytochrome c552 subunit
MESAIVSARAKREYVEAIYQHYRRAKRAEKRQILDEFCHVADYHRKSAIRLLTGPAPGAVRPRGTGTASTLPRPLTSGSNGSTH